jgi:hypothetical protein
MRFSFDIFRRARCVAGARYPQVCQHVVRLAGGRSRVRRAACCAARTSGGCVCKRGVSDPPLRGGSRPGRLQEGRSHPACLFSSVKTIEPFGRLDPKTAGRLVARSPSMLTAS